MENNSETKRPPKPMWGSEITIPSEFEDPNNEDDYSFSINNAGKPSVSSLPSDPSTHLTPTEEYLQTTKRLIESKSLPSRTTKKLKALYATYKSISGYGTTTFDETKVMDEEQSRVTKSHESKEPDETMKPEHSKKDPATDGKISLPDREETESASEDDEQSENLATQMYALFDQEENSAGSKSTMEHFATPWYGLQDFMFGRPCDPDSIKIDHVFSDFTLQDASYDQELKREIRKWLVNGSLASSTSSSVRRIVRAVYAELETKRKSDEGERSRSDCSPK